MSLARLSLVQRDVQHVFQVGRGAVRPGFAARLEAPVRHADRGRVAEFPSEPGQFVKRGPLLFAYVGIVMARAGYDVPLMAPRHAELAVVVAHSGAWRGDRPRVFAHVRVGFGRR